MHVLIQVRVTYAREHIDIPLLAFHDPPAQRKVGQVLVEANIDFVQRSADAKAVGRAEVNEFAHYSKAPFAHFCARGPDHVDLVEKIVEAEVDVRVDPVDSDGSFDAGHPAG